MIVNSSTFNFSEIMDLINTEYRPEVTKTAEKVVRKVAKDSAKRLRDESKAKFKEHNIDKPYWKGWTYTVDKTRFTTLARVHGKNGTYQLAHLLENGHALRGGGRTHTKAIVHIEPVAKWAETTAYNDIMDQLRSI